MPQPITVYAALEFRLHYCHEILIGFRQMCMEHGVRELRIFRWTMGRYMAHPPTERHAVVGLFTNPQDIGNRSRAAALVNVSSRAPESSVLTVCNDDRAIGRMAGQFLLRKRFSDFAHFRGVYRSRNIDSQVEAYQEELRKSGFASRELEWNYDWSGSDRNFLHEQVRELSPDTAIFCAGGDNYARLLQGLLWSAGDRFADQRAYLGVGNDPVDVGNDLTSVRVNSNEIGRLTAQHVLAAYRLCEPPKQRYIRVPPLGVVERSSTERVFSGDAIVQQAAAIVRAGPGQVESIDDLAKRVGISRRSLEVRFRNEVGTSPHAFIIEQRVSLARTLLSSTEMSIGEISEECGFADIAHFSRTFRKLTEMTASAYRNQTRSAA